MRAGNTASHWRTASGYSAENPGKTADYVDIDVVRFDVPLDRSRGRLLLVARHNTGTARRKDA